MQVWALFGLGGIELLAWGILFSLLLKRPLVAVILAVTTASVVLPVTSHILGGESSWHMDPYDAYVRAVPGRLMVLAIVIAIDIALGARWFREWLFSPAWRRSAGPWEVSGWAFDRAPSPPSRLGRLLWQDRRQSAAITAALIAMLLPTILFISLRWISPRIALGESSPGPVTGCVMVLGVIATWLSAPLLGASVFLADQTGCRFRFLAEHGVPPRLVWLSRQIRGVAVMLLGLLLLLPPVVGIRPEREAVGYLVGFVVVAYASGQLCSMAFRSGILAATFGTILTAVLCGWAALMQWFDLSWLWTVAPLPVSFLVATWLHAPNWLLERKTWRAWLCPVLVVAVPAIAIFAAIPLVRVYEIPLVSPGFDVEELTRPVSPEEKETLALYARAIELKQRKADGQAVTLALDASRRPLPGLRSARAHAPGPFEEMCLADFVLESAKKLRSEGKLDAALDRYVAAVRIAFLARQQLPGLADTAGKLEIRVCEELTQWAACPGQKPQRVLDASRTMEKLWRNPTSHYDAIRYGYLICRRILEGDREAAANFDGNPGKPGFAITQWLPWERARALRILNMLTAEQSDRCRKAEEALAAGDAAPSPLYASIPAAFYIDPVAGEVVVMVMPFGPRDSWIINDIEAYRRATQLVLALETWKLEHGSLPKSLEELKGKYLDQLPLGPYTGAAFRYEPKGLPYYVYFGTRRSADTKVIEPGQPLVSCESRDAWRANGRSNRGTGPKNGRAGDRSLETERWSGVYAFPIP